MVKYKSNRKQIKQRMDHASKVMLTAIGMAGSTHVKQVIQSDDIIDTGALLNSIDHKVADNSVYVGSKLTAEDYPVYLEKGTINMFGRPYLEPGIMDNLANLRSVAEKNYKL